MDALHERTATASSTGPDDDALAAPPFRWVGRERPGAVVLVCEHASAHVPAAYAGLGLSDADRHRHIGWDLGAEALALALAERLDSPLLLATYSRLLLDLNRATDAHDSIVARSEDIAVPGNAALGDGERARRVARIHAPFHAALDALLDARLHAGRQPALVSVHSFTPSYHGVARPWHAGVISRHDRRIADAVLAGLGADAALCLGDNLPYGPHEGAFYTMERHAEGRGLPGAVLEVRQDQLADAAGVAAWSERLAPVLSAAAAAAGAR
jgi:predicted N-formylglutamate amidohydrolase